MNMTDSEHDHLSDEAALENLLRTIDWWTEADCGLSDLCALRSLRHRLRALWPGSEAVAVSVVNQLLHKFDALPQMVRDGGTENYRLELLAPDGSVAAQLAIRTSMAVADLVQRGELHRLRLCARPECREVMVDLSRNGSKKFCAGRCGNRAAVAAYRARNASSGAVGDICRSGRHPARDIDP
nr:CGNR zinc finger domain-containing protein [Micromonospora sediminicola]